MLDDLRQDHIIEYDAFSAATATAREYLTWPRCVRPPCMAIVGKSFSGKTTIVRSIEREHRVSQNMMAEQDVLPILSIETPSRLCEIRLYSAMITALIGVDASASQPATLYRQVIRLMRSMETKILMIDNAHRIYRGPNQKGSEFADILLSIAAETGVHMILTGDEHFGRAIQSESQFNNRFRQRIYLEPWRDPAEHSGFLLTYMEAVGLLPQDGRVDTAFLQEVLNMAKGVLGEIVAILKSCAERRDLFPTGATVAGLRQLGYAAPLEEHSA
ncbi:TniB family NTP-binding protein [Rubrimonas sp.]|uniref:TniB family NTP-binding protein n=1 Tax=Rubrimonas sp. TaxID=2036015 RepID=UPI002FDCDC6D